MRKRILIFLSALLAVSMGQAKVRLPHLLSDGMIIQQNADAQLWGWAKAKSDVTVSASWTTEKFHATAGKDGTFIVKVKTPAASFTPLSITLDDGDGAATINNVLAGDVWVCGGQSNMEMPVKGFVNCPVEGYNNIVADAAGNRGLRYCKIPAVMSMKPLNDANCRWRNSDMQNVSDESATGYFFGRMLSRSLNIPIGLIETNKGGSRVESWLNEEYLKKYTDEKLDTQSIVKGGRYDYERTMLWGNGTFAPILNSTIKGIIFYQGCGNVGYHTADYAFRLSKLVEQWRQSFGDVPFYFVQIAPFNYGDDNVNGALLREQQAKAVDLIPNSDIVCTNDLVYPFEKGQIHPSQKRQVGERLAFIALNRDYGFKNLYCDSPAFEKMEISGDTCFIKLKNTYGGISRYNDIQGFEVAGADKVFHPAQAAHYWKSKHNPHNGWIQVMSKDVDKPVAVRYCFKNFQIGNLGNMGQLPLIPFRTDNW